jgi:hypothetical protein
MPQEVKPINPSLPRRLRHKIFERDEWRCWFCGVKTILPTAEDPANAVSATPDHFIPVSRGGSDEESNLVTACRRCNTQKNNRTIEEYRAYLRYCTTDYGRAILHLQSSMKLIPESLHYQIQETIDWLEAELPPTIFHGETSHAPLSKPNEYQGNESDLGVFE